MPCWCQSKWRPRLWHPTVVASRTPIGPNSCDLWIRTDTGGHVCSLGNHLMRDVTPPPCPSHPHLEEGQVYIHQLPCQSLVLFVDHKLVETTNTVVSDNRADGGQCVWPGTTPATPTWGRGHHGITYCALGLMLGLWMSISISLATITFMLIWWFTGGKQWMTGVLYMESVLSI